MDAKRLQANWEHLQAREAEIKAKDEEYRKMKAGWDGMVASSKQAEDQLASLRADLSAQQGLNRKLMAQVKEKDARIKALEAELAAFAGKSDAETTLKAELDSAKQAVIAMEAQLAAEAAARTAAITQAQDMADKARLLESQVEALNQAAAEATHRLQASLKQMEASHARLMDKELAIAAKEEEVSALGSHLQTAKGETALVEGRLAEALKDKEKAEARLAAMETAFMKSSQDAASLRSKQASFDQLRASEQARWAAERAELSRKLDLEKIRATDAIAALTACESAAASTQRTHEAAVEDWTSTKDELESEIAMLRSLHNASTEKHNAEMKRLADDLNDFLTREEGHKKDVKLWKLEAQRLGAELSKVTALSQSKQDEIIKCEAANARLMERLAELQQQVDAAKAEAIAAQSRADSEAKRSETFEKHVETLSASLKSAESSKADAVAEIKSAQLINRCLQAQLEEMRKTKADVEARLFAIENARSDEVLEATEAAREVIDAKNDEIRVLRMMLEAAKIDARTKAKEKQQLQKRLQQLK